MKKVIATVALVGVFIFGCSTLTSEDAQKLAFFTADAATNSNQVVLIGKQILAKGSDSTDKVALAEQLIPLAVKAAQDADSIAVYVKKAQGK